MLRKIYDAAARVFRSDLQNAFGDVCKADTDFPAKFVQAIAIVRQSHENFNAVAPRWKRDVTENGALAYIYGNAVILVPERQGAYWHFPTLAQSLEKTVNGIVETGIRFTDPGEVLNTVRRMDRAEKLRGTIGYTFGIFR